jgi:hypothetical protein
MQLEHQCLGLTTGALTSGTLWLQRDKLEKARADSPFDKHHLNTKASAP